MSKLAIRKCCDNIQKVKGKKTLGIYTKDPMSCNRVSLSSICHSLLYQVMNKFDLHD